MPNKRKLKRGGDDPVNQPTKTNGNSPNPSTPSLLDTILTFIKNNLIFSILVGVLLIVYVYLLTSKVKTEEEVTPEEVKLKCDSLDEDCPSGKKKNSDKDCTDNKCTKDDCCFDIKTCASHTCQSGSSNFTDKECSGPDCTEDECCKMNCGSYTTPCPQGTYYDSNLECKNNICNQDDCCLEKVACNSFSCPEGYHSNGITTPCPGNVCNKDYCCKLGEIDSIDGAVSSTTNTVTDAGTATQVDVSTAVETVAKDIDDKMDNDP